ncbi:hypothetical protein D623_10030566 [Myotis brandtii]|uniref:Uncharacterized protein n=1 Tax=Myotis brandtii TaxID=109478 RepID=S7MEK6_MYOBR|nr:hypothetical protein D623_10030566 [Myotis brandtii]
MTRYRELTRLLMLTVWPLTRSGCYLSLIAFTICRDYGTSTAMGLKWWVEKTLKVKEWSTLPVPAH